MERNSGFRILWLIREVEISMRCYGNRRLRQEGNISYMQKLILEYLAARGEKKVCASDIRAELDIPKASLSDNLKALCRKGYLKMEISPEDERKKWIALTDRIAENRQYMERSLEEDQTFICRGISDDDQRILERALGKMLENLREENKRRTNV